MWKFKDCSKIVNLNSRMAFMAMVTCGKWPLIFQTLSQFLNQHSRKLTRQSKYSYLNFLCCVVIDGHCLYYGFCFQHCPNYNFWKGPVWKNLSKRTSFEQRTIHTLICCVVSIIFINPPLRTSLSCAKRWWHRRWPQYWSCLILDLIWS